MPRRKPRTPADAGNAGPDGGTAGRKPSRSANKRQSHALQQLGLEIARLTPAERATLPLTPELAEALNLLDRITDHEGRRRQKQFIGRLMREADAEAIERALAGVRATDAAQVARFHAAESWRDRLLAAPEAELDALLAAFVRGLGDAGAGTAGAALCTEARRVIAQARTRDDASPAASRALFRLLAKALATQGQQA